MLTVFHGSSVEVITPNLKYSEDLTDFGKSFYATSDQNMAERWAANKIIAVISEYNFDDAGLSCKRFGVDAEWLDFISRNRRPDRYNDSKLPPVSSFPVVIGPTADDRMFKILNRYFDGELSSEMTLRCLSAVPIGEQIAIKEQNILDTRLKFVASYTLDKEAVINRKQASKSAREYVNDQIDAFLRGEFSERELNRKLCTAPNNSLDSGECLWKT